MCKLYIYIYTHVRTNVHVYIIYIHSIYLYTQYISIYTVYIYIHVYKCIYTYYLRWVFFFFLESVQVGGADFRGWNLRLFRNPICYRSFEFLPFGNQTLQWEIPYKWRFRWENHP